MSGQAYDAQIDYFRFDLKTGMSGPCLPRCGASICYTWQVLGVIEMQRREFIDLLGGATPPRPLHWPHEKTEWEKNHARDRSCFAQYRNNGFAAHRR